MRLYRVEDSERSDAVLALGRQARDKGWWHSYNNVLDADYLGFEAEASTISVYQPAVIPGLLQTADYAAASARASGAVTETDMDQVVAARLERQKLLQNDLNFLAIVDEAALLRLTHAPEGPREQLTHLIRLGEGLNRVALQVLPLSAGLHASMGSGFVILDYDDEPDPSLVYLEGRTGGTFLEKSEEVDDYRQVLTSLMRSALSETESIKTLKKLLKEV